MPFSWLRSHAQECIQIKIYEIIVSVSQHTGVFSPLLLGVLTRTNKTCSLLTTSRLFWIHKMQSKLKNTSFFLRSSSFLFFSSLIWAKRCFFRSSSAFSSLLSDMMLQLHKRGNVHFGFSTTQKCWVNSSSTIILSGNIFGMSSYTMTLNHTKIFDQLKFQCFIVVIRLLCYRTEIFQHVWNEKNSTYKLNAQLVPPKMYYFWKGRLFYSVLTGFYCTDS